MNLRPDEHNPADHASRGLTVKALPDHSTWIDWPEFQHGPNLKSYMGNNLIQQVYAKYDPKVKRVFASSVTEATERIVPRLERFSSWHRATKSVVLCGKYIQILRDRVRINANTVKRDNTPTIKDLRCVSIGIIKAVQVKAFSDQKTILETKANN